MVWQYLSSMADLESIKKQVCDVMSRATCSDSIEGAAFLADRFSDLLAELRERGFSIDVLVEPDEAPDLVLREVDLLVRTSIRLYQSSGTADEKKGAIALFNFAERKARHIGFPGRDEGYWLWCPDLLPSPSPSEETLIICQGTGTAGGGKLIPAR